MLSLQVEDPRALHGAKEPTTPPPSPKGGTAKAAFRLGRALRQLKKKIGEGTGMR